MCEARHRAATRPEHSRRGPALRSSRHTPATGASTETWVTWPAPPSPGSRARPAPRRFIRVPVSPPSAHWDLGGPVRGPNPVLRMKRTLGAGLQAPAALLPRANPLLGADAHAFTHPHSFSTQGPHWAGRRPPHPTPLPGRRPHARPPSVGWSASPDSRSPRLYLHQGGLPPARGGHTLEPRLHPAPQPRQLRGLRPRPRVTASQAQTKEA